MNWLTIYRIYKVVEAAANLAWDIGYRIGKRWQIKRKK